MVNVFAKLNSSLLNIFPFEHPIPGSLYFKPLQVNSRSPGSLYILRCKYSFVNPAPLSVYNLRYMYLGVDVGGSKTLLAAFSDDGKILHELKLKTNSDYPSFLSEVKQALESEFSSYTFMSGGVGAPAEFDMTTGIAKRFGNLSWKNVPLSKDLGAVTGLEIYYENDACLAGLSEALLIRDRYKRIVYITLSRGIGGKLIIDGMISRDVRGAEIGFMVLNHDGRLTEWEEFASGDALVKEFGKKASEIDDPSIWDKYAYNVAAGVQPLLTIWQPDAVIFGGGVGAHFEKFQGQLEQHLQGKFNSQMVSIPPLLKAHRPEEAVIYGCYDYIRQNVQ
jgi:predicted NBD/HSP70 family sugar kinase